MQDRFHARHLSRQTSPTPLPSELYGRLKPSQPREVKSSPRAAGNAPNNPPQSLTADGRDRSLDYKVRGDDPGAGGFGVCLSCACLVLNVCFCLHLLCAVRPVGTGTFKEVEWPKVPCLLAAFAPLPHPTRSPAALGLPRAAGLLGRAGAAGAAAAAGFTQRLWAK